MSNLKLEFTAFLIASHLVSFSLGMLLVMIGFEPMLFLASINVYLLLVIFIGSAVFCYWSVWLVRKIYSALK